MQATKAQATHPITLTMHLSTIEVNSAQRARRANAPEKMVRKKLHATPIALHAALLNLDSCSITMRLNCNT
jgi:hypothetical protein